MILLCDRLLRHLDLLSAHQIQVLVVYRSHPLLLLKLDGLLVECRDHDVLHAVDVCLLYLLEDVGDISEQDGLATDPALLKHLQLFDVLKHLVVVSGEFITS